MSAATRYSPRDRQALKLVEHLMSIPGRSREEGRIAAAVMEVLRGAGVPDTAMQFDQAHRKSAGETGNLIVKLPGTIRGPRRLLMAHLDTVPICVGSSPKREGDRICSRDQTTGLGGDNRAGVATILHAVCTCLSEGWDYPPLTLFFPVQEEIGLCGARYVSVSKLGKPAMCFNWDGGDPSEVCVGATGDDAVEVRIQGIPSHAGVHPERGVSAAAVFALALAELVNDGWHGLIVKGDSRGTSNVGVVTGGDATNVVMPELCIRAEVRSHDPQFRKAIIEAWRAAFERAAKHVVSTEGKKGTVSFRTELKYEAFRIPEDSACVIAARAAIAQAGATSTLRVSNGGLDANWMSAHGLPTVTLGCGQHAIHTRDEWLSIPEYLLACEVARQLVCGSAANPRLLD